MNNKLSAQHKPQQANGGLLNPNWKYIPSLKTDIAARFAAEYGWIPPSKGKQ
jgi:hypothetical protein